MRKSVAVKERDEKLRAEERRKGEEVPTTLLLRYETSFVFLPTKRVPSCYHTYPISLQNSPISLRKFSTDLVCAPVLGMVRYGKSGTDTALRYQELGTDQGCVAVLGLVGEGGWFGPTRSSHCYEEPLA